MIRTLFFFVLFFSLPAIFFPLQVSASHIVGGELSYECLGNNNYLITLKVYRDCFNGNQAYDDPTNIYVYDGLGNQILGISPIAIPFPGSDTLPNDANNPCLIVPPNICVEQAIFQAQVNLPPNATGYKMIYQRCCRNITTVNILNPSSTGATYEATVPDSSVAICNSSPYFVNFPPTVICVDLPFTFDHSAIDPDGDSLVYGLCAPYDGAIPQNPYPSVPYPYNPVNFSFPYSAADPMGGAPPMSIDPQTGWLTVTPTSIGQYVVGVCVTEYRNGVMISLHRSDFQFNVTVCTLPPVASVPAVLNGCDNSVFTFPNYSTGATSYFWDFGVPGINSDTSVLFSPSYAYPDTGIYTVTLYADPDALCADTATIQVNVYPSIMGNMIAPDGCEGIPVQFFDSSTTAFGTISSWSWNFANLGNSALQNPSFTFNTAGGYLITLIVGNTIGCVDTVSASITIHPQPLAFAWPDTTICGLDTIQLSGGGIGDYLWLPDYNLSNDSVQNPFASPDVTTQYILLVTNQWGCFDQDTITITVIPPAASVPAVLNSCDDFVFTFPNYSSGANTYFWDFGVPGINSDTSTLFSPTYTYSDTGVYTVTLYAIPGTGCGDTATTQVYVYPTITGNMIAPDGCEGMPVQFFDSSTTTFGNIDSWSWNFANLGNSALQNPSFTFNTAGLYLITLIVGNTMGCVDTVSSSITINPKPQVLAYPDSTICYLDTIQLFGTGVGIYQWLPDYNLSDDSVQNPFASPDVTTQYILQVTDSWGCFGKDTITITVVDSVNLIASNDTVICPLGEAQLNASGGFNYFWLPPTGLSNQSIPNPVATPTTSTAYTVYANIGSCIDSAIVNVGVNPFPNIAAGPDQTICIGDSVMIEVCCGSNYLWDPANTLTDPYIASPIAFPSGTTVYHVAAGDTGLCPLAIIDSVTVFVIDPPPLITTPDTVILPGTSAQLYSIGGQDYLWIPSTSLSDPNIFNPIASPAETIEYYVYATTAEGCKLSDSLTIRVEIGPVVFFPNAFTPNQDGTNDYFHPIVFGYFETEIFEVFNRWGQLRYKSKDIEQGWDGKYKGENSPVGTYVYYLKGKSLTTGKPYFKKGNVELLR